MIPTKSILFVDKNQHIFQITLLICLAVFVLLGCSNVERPLPTATLAVQTTLNIPLATPTSPSPTSTPSPTVTPTPTAIREGFHLLKSFDIHTITHFALSNNGQFIALSDFPNTAKVYDFSSGAVLNELVSPLASFAVEGKVAFLANDSLLATQFITDVVTSTLGSIYIWDWLNEEITAKLNVNPPPGYRYPCYIIDFEISQNENLLAALQCERIEIWNLQTKVLLRTIEQVDVTDIAFSASGNWLAVALLAKGKPPVQIWELNDCNATCAIKFELFPPTLGKEDWIEATKVLFYNDILAAIIDGNLRLWNFGDEKEITWPQSALTSPIIQIAFSPTGILATLSEEGLLTLFDPFTGMKIGEQQIIGAAQIAFSSDGMDVIVGGDLNLQVWTIPTQ